jgi:hypothetical protein
LNGQSDALWAKDFDESFPTWYNQSWFFETVEKTSSFCFGRNCMILYALDQSVVGRSYKDLIVDRAKREEEKGDLIWSRWYASFSLFKEFPKEVYYSIVHLNS